MIPRKTQDFPRTNIETYAWQVETLGEHAPGSRDNGQRHALQVETLERSIASLAKFPARQVETIDQEHAFESQDIRMSEQQTPAFAQDKVETLRQRSLWEGATQYSTQRQDWSANQSVFGICGD